MSKERITILVEGDTDVNFLNHFLKFREFDLNSVEINVIDVGGKDSEISEAKKKVMVKSNEKGINLLIEDLDDDEVEQRRQKVAARLNGFNYECYFIGENQKEKQLEYLLLASTGKDLTKYDDCFSNFIECLSNIEFADFIPTVKEKVYWYTMILLNKEESAQRKHISPSKIDYSNKRYFDLSSTCYDSLDEFLSKYIKKKSI